MYLNKVFIIGNLTRDPELKSLPSGTNVTNMSLATNSTYNDKEGNRQETTEYHNIVIFGRQAETTAQYLKKGSSALVEGRLQTRSWEGENGKKNYRTEIIADRVQFGSRGSEGGASNSTPTSNEAGPGSSNTDKTPDYPEEEISPEDIPF